MAVIGVSNILYAINSDLSVTVTGATEDEQLGVTVDAEKFLSRVNNIPGTYFFENFDGEWALGNDVVQITEFGFDSVAVSELVSMEAIVARGDQSYIGGGVMSKAVEVNVEIETGESNDFYADNAIAETDKTFAGGSVTLTTADLSQDVSRAILGLKEQSVGTITGITDTGVKELIYDNDQNTPYLGVGFVIKKKVNGVYKWRAVVLTKVMFDVPDDAATTQGETIEWQTSEISGTVIRDDKQNGMWKREATFSTEGQAVTYLKNRLSIA